MIAGPEFAHIPDVIKCLHDSHPVRLVHKIEGGESGQGTVMLIHRGNHVRVDTSEAIRWKGRRCLYFLFREAELAELWGIADDRLDADGVGASVDDLEDVCGWVANFVQADFRKARVVFVILREDQCHHTLLGHIIIKLEIHHEWALHVCILEVKVANLGSVPRYLSHKVSLHHAISCQTIYKGINFLTQLLFWSQVHHLSRLLDRVNRDNHCECITERLSLVEIQKHVFIDCLWLDPVGASREEQPQLSDVAAQETLLLQKVTLSAILRCRKRVSFAHPSSLRHLHSDRNILGSLYIHCQVGVFNQREASWRPRVKLLHTNFEDLLGRVATKWMNVARLADTHVRERR